MNHQKLSREQEQIFVHFIITFFEPTGSKRKNSGNELSYVVNTLDRLFKKYFGFNLDRRIVEVTFEKLGYAIYNRNETYNPDTKKHFPSIDGEIKSKVVGIGNEIEAPYTYFEIDPKIVRQLMRTTVTMTENSNQAKHFETLTMQKRILEFITK